MAEAHPERPRRVVIALVHGTFARKATWASNPKSKLRTFLTEKLADNGLEVEFYTFRWGGGNRLAHRVAGSTSLRVNLHQLISAHPNAYHFVIAHSHGGDVALRALNDPMLARSVSGLICLATPFIVTLPRTLWAVRLPVVAIGLAAYLVGLNVASARLELGPITTLTWGLGVLLMTGVGVLIWTFRRLAPVEVARFGRLRVIRQPRTRPLRTRVRAQLAQEDRWRPPVLCLWAPGDEAFLLLNTLETLVNVPRLFLHRAIVLPVSLILLGLRMFDFRSGPWSSGIVPHLGSLVDVASVGTLSRFAALLVDWLIVVLLAFAGLSMLAWIASFLRILTLGLWRGKWTPLMDRFFRETVALVPVHFRDVEFAAMDASTTARSMLYHGRVYQEPWALDRILQFTLKCLVRDYRLRHQKAFVDSWAGVLHHANVLTSAPDRPMKLEGVTIERVRWLLETYSYASEGVRFADEQYEDVIDDLIRAGYLKIEEYGPELLVTVDQAATEVAFKKWQAVIERESRTTSERGPE